jgi:uncharacterized membrane protein YvbJ
MENEEIKKLIAQTEESMKHLEKEVKIFERYLKRIDFKDTQVKVGEFWYCRDRVKSLQMIFLIL